MCSKKTKHSNVYKMGIPGPGLRTCSPGGSGGQKSRKKFHVSNEHMGCGLENSQCFKDRYINLHRNCEDIWGHTKHLLNQILLQSTDNQQTDIQDLRNTIYTIMWALSYITSFSPNIQWTHGHKCIKPGNNITKCTVQVKENFAI